MILTEQIKDAIFAHSLSDKSNEVCGLIVYKDDYPIAVPCKNISELSTKRFIISSIDYFKAARLGKVVAAYHSHVSDNEKFSILDKINSEGHKLPLILYCVPKNSFFIYDPSGYKYPYLGRSFKMGETDCLTLIIDYYKRELNIDITNYESDRKDGFFMENPSIFSKKDYLQMAIDQGFSVVDKPLKEHDILFMKTENHSFPSHFAVYIGADKILHQPRNCESKLDELSDVEKNIVLIFRKNG